MNDSTNYRNAPIVEAIIHIQVAFLDGGSERALATAKRVYSSDFARSHALQRINLQFNTVAHKEASSSISQESAGWKFTSASNDRVLQILPDAFVYSHLHPYTNWETFSAEAHSLWNRFLEDCQPDKVVRVALRYINRLRLPAHAFELGDYLNFAPKTPHAFGPIHGLVTQVQLPQPGVAPDAVALVTLASEPSPDATSSTFALDLDVFTRSDLNASDSKVWEILYDFRLRKNRLFEAVLTDKFKEMIR